MIDYTSQVPLSQKEAAYKWYFNNYEEKNTCRKMNKLAHKEAINLIHRLISLGMVKKKYYCPHCLTEVNRRVFYRTPLFTYGCRSCRIRKDKK